MNGGSISEKVDWVRDHMEKSIPIKSVFSQDENIDIIGVTKGKGVKGKQNNDFHSFFELIYFWQRIFLFFAATYCSPEKIVAIV